MVIIKNTGVLLAASALSFGLFATVTNASTLQEQEERVQIKIATTETVVSKSELIKKFKAVFPNKFNFLTENDFHMRSGGHRFQNDDIIRYDLSFHKTINGKSIHGNITFAGENFEVENFYYQPVNVKDALFPAKVSKDAAKNIASDFIKKFTGGDNYQLDTDSNGYFTNRILTEPIAYSFSFVRTANQVAIADQSIHITVLGNGEVTNFYRMPVTEGPFTFDDAKLSKDKNEMLEQVKKNLSVNLQYQVNYDYESSEADVQLVYKPSSTIMGVHAHTGKWQTANNFSAELPKEPKIEFITSSPLKPKQDGITLEEAKKLAEQLLKVDSDKIKLNIQSIDERENNGQPVFSIEYMYEYRNGGSGTNLEINKLTGEIIQYSDMKNELLAQYSEGKTNENTISVEQAKAQAIKYLKEWAPSNLHNYAKPIAEPQYDKNSRIYSITFPRIVNGLVVEGDQISVSIAADGSLNNLNVHSPKVDNWPSKDKAIAVDKAKAIYEEALNLKLQYVRLDNNDKHYNLVYAPVLNDNSSSYIDATTGELKSFNNNATSSETISHPWAEQELNYLIHAKIIDIKDSKTFNANASVSSGEALKVILKSLTYFYPSNNNEQGEMNQSFDNIDPKHPLYQVVERAVTIGILDPENQSFNPDTPITREELAVWYIRLLGFEQLAKHTDLYNVDYADAAKVRAEYKGYVAIANALELLTTDKNNFNPNREVTYAELAVSTIRLAYELSEKGTRLNYY
ncbi:PepSY1/2 domain-containing protein [Solibacillus sp. FSL H8-0538]|uniref:PepSY1/2 domain-containing protein n=1 Tax=Solibacillus sp. FSL H8-0538 TaxID=2921400 RepID=UPI0030FC2132